LFSGHNFSTRNTRKPIKGSKNSDSSLVSNKNLSQKIPSSSWAQGQNLSQNGLEPIPLTSPTKKQNPKLLENALEKKFFGFGFL